VDVEDKDDGSEVSSFHVRNKRELQELHQKHSKILDCATTQHNLTMALIPA
jgi:hypothetical protein